MPLSKVKNRERMRDIRLHAKKRHAVVQPKAPIALDADGNPIPEYE